MAYVTNQHAILRDIWGRLCGYRRWAIPREVARNMHLAPGELMERSQRLVRSRYEHALAQLPGYVD